MPTNRVSYGVTGGGLGIPSGALSRTGTVALNVEESLPAGTAGSLTTRTTDTAGIFTATAHGIDNGDFFDVYWSGGIRYGLTASAADADTVTFLNTGAGDVLPANLTEVIVCERVAVVGVFDFDAGNYLSVHADQRCHVDFEDSGNASVGAIECRVADQPYIWADDYGDVSGGGTTIPITGNAVEELQASNGSVTAATLFVLALLSGA